MREHDASQGKPACRVAEPTYTPYQDPPPPKKPKAQVTGPVQYDLSGELPQQPEKLKDTVNPMPAEEQPVPPPRAQHMPDEPESSDADVMSDSSLSDASDVILGKAKGRALTRKTESKSRTQPGHLLDAHHIYLASCPGHIPDGLGVVLRDSNPKHDNTMWGTVGKEFYHSPLSNIVYISDDGNSELNPDEVRGTKTI
jgi:hypothetical protein